MAMFQSTAVSNGPAGEPCQTRSAAPSQTAEDFCPICYVDTLGAQPVIRLACGHIVHAGCAKVCHTWVLFKMTLIMFCIKGSVFRTINTVVLGLFRTGVFLLEFFGLCSDMCKYILCSSTLVETYAQLFNYNSMSVASQTKLDNKWSGVRITFGFSGCPLCADVMRHPSIDKSVADMVSYAL